MLVLNDDVRLNWTWPLCSSAGAIPVTLISEDICGRWLALYRYAKYRHRSIYHGQLSGLSYYRPDSDWNAGRIL